MDDSSTNARTLVPSDMRLSIGGQPIEVDSLLGVDAIGEVREEKADDFIDLRVGINGALDVQMINPESMGRVLYDNVFPLEIEASDENGREWTITDVKDIGFDESSCTFTGTVSPVETEPSKEEKEIEMKEALDNLKRGPGGRVFVSAANLPTPIENTQEERDDDPSLRRRAPRVGDLVYRSSGGRWRIVDTGDQPCSFGSRGGLLALKEYDEQFQTFRAENSGIEIAYIPRRVLQEYPPLSHAEYRRLAQVAETTRVIREV